MTAAQYAQAALDAHDALVAADAREPALNDDGMPYDPDAWLHWNDTVRRPVYDAWSAAMDALDASLGEHVSRHPFNFRPICERIVGGAS